MSLIVALWLALTAILAQPVQPPADFIVDIVLHCQPVMPSEGKDLAGCIVGDPQDETLYAGWSQGQPVTGP